MVKEMKNKEKYEECVLTFVCDGSSFGVYKKTGEMERCMEMHCTECLFYEKKGTCNTSRRKWLESEYIEKSVISKRDRAFLEYLGEKLKYIARSRSDNLMAYQNSAEKREDGWVIDSGAIKSLQKLNIDFPMVKWEDSEPWLIEDLKQLEVVDEYE